MPNITVNPNSSSQEPERIRRKAIGLARASVGYFRRQSAFLARLTLLLFLGTFATEAAKAQTLHARISATPGRVHIEAQLPGVTTVLSFRNVYGSVIGLGDRIENVKSGDVLLDKIAPGEFKTDRPFTSFSYDVKLTAPSRPTEMSHVSWLSSERGLLMLADLLPRSIKDSGNFSTAHVEISVPADWSVFSSARNLEPGKYSVEDPLKAVFLVGRNLVESSKDIGPINFSIVTTKDWPVNEKDVRKVVSRIVNDYSKSTGFRLKRDASLILLPFPNAGPEKWTAETRGNAVVLLLGAEGNRKEVSLKLGIVLSHELFHLWVPNSLALSGDYDWFFEGFTLYQALKTDLRQDFINFNGFLTTIGRVYDSYLSSAEFGEVSLIQASEQRWTGPPSLVYDKGMLAAFVYDLRLKRQSECKASFDEIYQRLFRVSSTGQGTANETIIGVLNEPEHMKYFGREFVENAVKVDLETELAPFGIYIQKSVAGTKFFVGNKPDKLQKKLFKCLTSGN